MKKLKYLAIIVLLLAGCKASRNAQKSVTAKPEVERSPAVKLKAVDSTSIFKNQLNNIINTPADFNTFYAKAKANFSSPQASGNATVYIRMQKDSVIWLSITGPLNIEGARVLITPDSVKIMNKLEGYVQLSSIAHLQQITKFPFSFNDFQNLIIGKPYLPQNASVDYKFKKDSIDVYAVNNIINYIFSFNKNNYYLGQSNFKASTEKNIIDANIFYNDYQSSGNINFSTSRDIAVTGSSPMNLQLNFREFNFNQPQTFPFTISKNYSVKYD